MSTCGRTSERRHWDDFWRRDRDLDDIYDNDGRIQFEVSRRMDVSGRTVLEVGAATARDSILLAGKGAFAVALDYSSEALRLAGQASERAGKPLALVCADALALPFRDGTFDLVFHQGVLEHFRDPLPLLKENARVVREDGVVLVDVPQTFHVYTVMKKVLMAFGAWFAGWETQYTPRSLSALLRKAGLRPLSVYGRFFSPSLAYRILRELSMKAGLKLPLRPVIIPPVHRLRARLRRSVESSPAGPRLGSVMGMFAGRERKG